MEVLTKEITQETVEDKAAPDELSMGDFVQWKASGGVATGKIVKVFNDGPVTDIGGDTTIQGTEDDPAARIRLYRDGEPTEVFIGHKFSALDKIDSPKHLDFTFEVKELGEPENNVAEFKGYASTFGNIDKVNDIVMKGAFRRTLMGSMPKLLWQHDTEKVIGVVSTASEDDIGLMIEGKISLDVQKGKEAYALLKMGAINTMSIGYRVKDYNMQGSIRELKEVELYEVSLVTFEANSQAKVTDVKSRLYIDSERDYEKFLREAGFSRKEAKALVVEGFKGLGDSANDGQRDVVQDEQLGTLNDAISALKTIIGSLNDDGRNQERDC